MSDSVAILITVGTPIITGIVVFLFQVWFVKRQEKKKKADDKENNVQKAFSLGISSLLIERLEEKGDTYCKRKYATTREKTIYDNQYRAYNILTDTDDKIEMDGGISDLHGRVMALPTFKDIPSKKGKSISEVNN